MSKNIINNRNFIFLWFGHLISHAGDAIYVIALPWLILDMTGSKMQTALVVVNAYLPAILFGFFAGVIVDKYNRKNIMIVSDIMRFLLVALIPVAISLKFATPVLLGIITFFLSMFATLFYPARDCLIPSIINSDQLHSANAAITLSGQLSHLLGPLFAGICISIFGLTHLFSVNAISFLFSIIMISLISIPNKEKFINSSISHIEGIKQTFNYIKNNQIIKRLISLTFINNIFIMGPAFLGIAVFVKEILKAEIVIYAYLESSMAMGMIIGSIIFRQIARYFRLINIFFLGMVIDGVTFSLLYFVNNTYLAIFVLFIHGLGIPFIIIARTTLIQMLVPDNMRGRIFAMIYLAVMGTTAISIGLVGLFLEYINSSLLFLIFGICAACCVIIGLALEEFRNLKYRIN
tara:strand:- start:2230 stop:3447 length:1218 start_codon:yes stop_codon:yes gene_type:complete